MDSENKDRGICNDFLNGLGKLATTADPQDFGDRVEIDTVTQQFKHSIASEPITIRDGIQYGRLSIQRE